MVLEILCVEPINPQYSGVLETCVALRYWFFEVLGSESVNLSTVPRVHPSCKRSRKFRVGWVDGSIHIISKGCIISHFLFQKTLVWLSNFDGELR